ncbi:MAG TPA: glycoside hydrolase family 2 TIM barrel-domain containing protein [Terriglobia bacterium]|jgi:beta-mannosidase|nr:glycoside hydrolase family 2 TIM barrel-domain containing protein [Terriglobia bacterium]
MKRTQSCRLIIVLIVFSSWVSARTQEAPGSSQPVQEAARISLDGKWRLYYFPQDKFQISQPDQLKSQGVSWIEATVPGNVELDLSRKGELPEDLFFAENLRKLKPYELYEWWYQREFPSPGGIAGRRVELRFHGVDCFATYWLNGTELGVTSDALIEQSFDVTGKLKTAGPNVLTVRLKSPIIEAAHRRYDPAYTVNAGPTNQEAIWVRKPAHSYGWDIMPRAVSAGLWRPVELIIHSPNEITDMYFTTFLLDTGRATLSVSYELSTDLALLSRLRLKVEGRCGDSTFSRVHQVEFTAGRFQIEVKNPRLWWPRGYGIPSLYHVTTQLLDGDKVLASRRDTVGIRKVELIRTETTSIEKPGQFLFKVNGVPILIKGSNWVPADAFHSRDAGRYEKILALFIDLGCNFLRSWGGNVYEDHAFFDICDRNGIMVWQDFAMACAIYPQTPEFLEVMRQEAVAVVRKLRNHPSLALWSGDNEVDQTYYFSGLDPAHNKITREVLPQVVFQCDPYRPYLPSSPYISPEVIATRQLKLMPEDHLWGPRDYFKSPFYTQHTAHFVSEIGYHGCPGLSSIKRFVDAQHLWPWPNNAQWVFHSTDMTGNPYRINLMANQVKELFGTVPDNIEDFILGSQVSQAEAKKFFVEMTRLKKWHSTGVIWWNVMDGWPQFSDAIVDYYFNKKLAYYYIRRVQQPVCVMVDEPKDWQCRVVVGNDSREDANGHYRIWDANSGETLLEGDYASKANENIEVGRIPIYHSDKRLFLIEWTANGKKYTNHYLQGFPPFSLDQYRSWLGKIAALQNDFDVTQVGK